MRKILAILLLIPAQLFAQSDPTSPAFTIDYTLSQLPSPVSLEMLNQNQGVALNLGDDSASGIINLGFKFLYYDKEFSSIRISNNGVASLGQLTINGCCGGYNLSQPGNEYGIFGIQTDLINLQTMNPYYRFFDEEGSRRFVIGWYDMPIFYDGNFRSTFELTLFEGTNGILINFGDINNGNRFFTAGIKGSDELGYELIYSGTDGDSLDYSSWYFDPKLTVVQSSVDCTVNPTDQSCIIDSIVDTDDTTMVAGDFNNNSNNGSNDGSDINDLENNYSNESNILDDENISILVDNDEESEYQEENLQELGEELETQLLAENNDRELENNESAEKLTDKIDPSILSIVLSIVEQTSQVDNSGANAGQSSVSGQSINSAATGSVTNINQTIGVVSGSTSTDSLSDFSEVSVSGDLLTLNAANIDSVNGIELETLKTVQASSQSAFTDNSAFDQSESTEFALNALDPNNPANQFFNNMPSIANQEAAGVLKNNNDDKSDAEKRAEEVVAANAKEQEEISNNYMDADQSGLVAAMGIDTDFTSYRSAMLQDASAWYKPEDIYKNVVIKDNVRSAFFLEKGSTDTYKKMVGEQYK